VSVWLHQINFGGEYIKDQEKSTINENTALVVVLTAYFLTPFMSSAVNLAIPAIGMEFSSSTLLLSWLVTGYSLATAAFLLPFGRLSDIIGRKKIFVTGMFLFSFFTLLSGKAWSMPGMITFRVCQGISSAMIFSTGMAIIASVYPPHKRGRALGFSAAVSYTGLSLGPALGGFINHYFGWRIIFYLTTLASVSAALLAAWRLKGEWTGAKGEPFDLTGSVYYILAFAATLYGLSALSQTAWAKYALGTGLVVLAFFFSYESKQEYPVFQVGLFRGNTTFTFANLAAMINYSATFAIAFLVSLQLQVVMGCDSQLAGLILLSQPLITAILSPFVGSLSDRVAPRIVASFGMALSAVGLFLFIFVTAATALWLIVANLVLSGIGFAFFITPNNNAIMGAVDKRFYGMASSIQGTMRNTGQAISMAIVTLLLAVYGDGSGMGQEHAQLLANGFRTAFMVFTGICCAGIFTSLAANGHKNHE
jgi:EmrB/QacA subfamily drug resistance transporter